jgi:putative thioredoxin
MRAPTALAKEKPAAAAGDQAVIETTTKTFAKDVLEPSRRQPVLVDFWAPWCGPCRTLGPIIEKTVRATRGAVRLVKMNIDDHPAIAGQLGIQSIPAVIAFDKGKPLDGFMGALPESQVRGFIERLVGPLTGGADALLAEAEAAIAADDLEGAAELYARILTEDETNPKAIGGLAKLHVEAGDLDQARAVLSMAPPPAPGKDPDPALAAALAAIHLAEQAEAVGDLAPLQKALAENPDDHQARFDLAVALNAKGERDAAANELLDVVKRDRAWNEGAARKQLLQFFEAWGLMDPSTVAARRKLSAIWF